MQFRAIQAKWFETYIPRNRTVSTLDNLASSGLVELESDSTLASALDLAEIREAVKEFHSLKQRYEGLFNLSPSLPRPVEKEPEVAAREALEYLREWCKTGDNIRETQHQLETERTNLQLLLECLQALRDASIRFPQLSHHGEYLFIAIFACPKSDSLEANPSAAIDELIPGAEHDFYLVADLPDKQAAIAERYHCEACRLLDIPNWLSALTAQQEPLIRDRIDEIGHCVTECTSQYRTHSMDPEAANAIENMKLLTWYIEHAEELTGNHKLCHVTGWTTAENPQVLQRILRQTGVVASVRFSRPPESYKPPVNMQLPAWARPFALFVELLGTPDSNEVNPSLLLPVMVPLLFGYMFPDIGHGLCIALFSILFYQRWPDGRFLLPCGISAMLFGFVFGEFFGIEDLLEPLWFKPLEDPLMILIPPLLAGIGLMLIGLMFSGIEALWRSNIRGWLHQDMAVLVMYLAACASLLYQPFLGLSVLAMVWFVLGGLIINKQLRPSQVLVNLGLLLQSILELLLNTLSFLRVGAFALAHAALSYAVFQIVEGIDQPLLHNLLLVMGHALIIVLEGMVVFVQTTRLVLFEFFTRFLKAEGRIFRPLPVPTKRQGQ